MKSNKVKVLEVAENVTLLQVKILVFASTSLPLKILQNLLQ